MMKTKIPEGLELLKELPEGGYVTAKTAFKEAVYKSDSVAINGVLYSKTIEDGYKSIGFVRIFENSDEYVEVFAKSSKWWLILVALLLLFLSILAWFFLSKGPEKETVDIKSPLTVASGKDNSDIPEKPPTDYTEYIELPYLSTLDVSDDYNLVALSNPENNTVYMRFSVDYNGEKIYSNEEVVAPGKFIEWHPKDYFKEPGQYDVNIYIETFDINDQSSCSGANIASKLTVR